MAETSYARSSTITAASILGLKLTQTSNNSLNLVAPANIVVKLACQIVGSYDLMQALRF